MEKKQKQLTGVCVCLQGGAFGMLGCSHGTIEFINGPSVGIEQWQCKHSNHHIIIIIIGCSPLQIDLQPETQVKAEGGQDIECRPAASHGT